MRTVLEQVRDDLREDEQPWRAMAAVYSVTALICTIHLAHALEHLDHGRPDLAGKRMREALALLEEIREADDTLYGEALG